MPLFGVKCINHIIVAGEILNYEESVVVVEADFEEDARQSATAYAIAAQHSYLNDEGETVEWKFHGLDVQEYELTAPLTPPVEVYSKIHTYYGKKSRRSTST